MGVHICLALGTLNLAIGILNLIMGDGWFSIAFSFVAAIGGYVAAFAIRALRR